MDVEWATQRLVNLMAAWREQMVDVLGRFGMSSIRELRGRTDCLRYLGGPTGMGRNDA